MSNVDKKRMDSYNPNKDNTLLKPKEDMNKIKIINDDPTRRMIETEQDLRIQDLPIGKLRLDALKHVKEMPISDDGSLPSPTKDYIYSQASTSGKSNWLQMGPTAIPDGQTASTYYWDPNIPALITG